MILALVSATENGIVLAKYLDCDDVVRLSFVPVQPLESVPEDVRNYCAQLWTAEVIDSFSFGGIIPA